MKPMASGDLQLDSTALLQRLIRCNTVNPPGDERLLQEGLAADLRAGGFEVELLGAVPERPNLVARLRGAAEGPVLCLLSHVDTVLATAGDWTHDPWSGDVADGCVWGRGALDMKSQTAAAFFRDVSGLAGNDARRALAGCRLARRYEGDCLYGVAREIVNADADGARGGRFCQRAPRRHRDRCLEGVGSVLAAVAPNPARLRRACRDAGGRLATACLRGAGLAS